MDDYEKCILMNARENSPKKVWDLVKGLKMWDSQRAIHTIKWLCSIKKLKLVGVARKSQNRTYIRMT